MTLAPSGAYLTAPQHATTSRTCGQAIGDSDVETAINRRLHWTQPATGNHYIDQLLHNERGTLPQHTAARHAHTSHTAIV